uniref:Uncharacterized protein n=1 Tax=Anguilla anguilla TaxID=7936 RepID=A0A0E9QZ44_ANGAN
MALFTSIHIANLGGFQVLLSLAIQLNQQSCFVKYPTS